MERDYGYVKVRMGPLFPQKRDSPSYFEPDDREQPTHYRDLRFLQERDHDNWSCASPHHDNKLHVWNCYDDPPRLHYSRYHHLHSSQERTGNHYHTPMSSDLYNKSPSSDMQHRRVSVPISNERESRHQDWKQVQRSKSLHRPRSPQAQRSPSLERHRSPQVQRPNSLQRPRSPEVQTSTSFQRPRSSQVQRSPSLQRPASPFQGPRGHHMSRREFDLKQHSPSVFRPIPQPDYSFRSRSVDPQYRPRPERRMHEERTSQETRNYNHHNYSESKGHIVENSTDKLKKPYIPKPDYTWHRKKTHYYH